MRTTIVALAISLSGPVALIALAAYVEWPRRRVHYRRWRRLVRRFLAASFPPGADYTLYLLY